jgi:hypothetical protein
MARKLTFSVGKFALFTLYTILGGLGQVWFLYLALYALGREHSLPVILGDGGLFFFNTSLTASSAFLLVEELRGKSSPWHRAFTTLAIVISISAVVYYIAIFTHHPGNSAPFHDHVKPQLALAVLAFTYAGFVAKETGFFSR